MDAVSSSIGSRAVVLLLDSILGRASNASLSLLFLLLQLADAADYVVIGIRGDFVATPAAAAAGALDVLGKCMLTCTFLRAWRMLDGSRWC